MCIRSPITILTKTCSLSPPPFLLCHEIDKDRDVEAITQRIRNELNDAHVRRQGVNSEMEVLREQLAESKAGLLAAARISDQLEIAQVATATVKEERKYFAFFWLLSK